MQRTISAHGLHFIGKNGWEGEKLTLYWDAKGGCWTIGEGHAFIGMGRAASLARLRAELAALNLGEPSGPDGSTITEPQADGLLAQDLAPVQAAINAIGVALSQNAFDALCSFGINLGTGMFNRGHTLADALRRGDMAGAAAAFELYDHDATGAVNQGLLNRRRSERDLFVTPDEPALEAA
jgi:GH24 family phage-related lysozyme (muramidase)